MGNKKLAYLKIIFLSGILLTVTFTGCIKQKQKSEETVIPEVKMDHPSILPDWADGEYHDYDSTKKLLMSFNDRFPDLVSIFPIGESVLNRDIWCIRITNENNSNQKYSCLIDGCIHGNEWEAGESCLYLAEYLLINFGGNKTITSILNTSEIYIVPLVNPDGRQNDDRFNANGIDLNRNFDVDFGRLLGRSIPIGKIFGLKVFKWVGIPKTRYFWTNSGRYPFSEPETRSIRDLMKTLNYHDFSFYVNCHTAVHMVAGPSKINFKPEFELTNREETIIDDVLNWVGKNTEYMPYYAKEGVVGGGYASDWCFKEFRIPSFIFEILSQDYDPWFGHGKHDHLVHWMETTLPFFMYLLVNIENLHDWKTPNIEPALPEGIPPVSLE